MRRGSILGAGPEIAEGMTAGNGRLLMFVYSGGFVAVFGTFMLLRWNGWRQRDLLKLDALAVYDARASIRRHLISVTLGVLPIAIAALFPISFLPLAGLIFFLMGPAHGLFGYLNGRRREQFEASLCQPSGTLPPVTRSAGESTV